MINPNSGKAHDINVYTGEKLIGKITSMNPTETTYSQENELSAAEWEIKDYQNTLIRVREENKRLKTELDKANKIAWQWTNRYEDKVAQILLVKDELKQLKETMTVKDQVYTKDTLRVLALISSWTLPGNRDDIPAEEKLAIIREELSKTLP